MVDKTPLILCICSLADPLPEYHSPFRFISPAQRRLAAAESASAASHYVCTHNIVVNNRRL